MKNIFTAIFILCLTTLGMAQSTEQINPADPNYSVELNAILQTISGNTNSLSQSVATTSGYFSNGILSTKSGGTGQNSSNWPAGDVVYMSSLGTFGHEVLPHSSIVFLSSGTFTAPSGVNIVFITEIGGGGGGGSNNSANNGGGGGGGGGSFTNIPYAVTPGNTYTVTVGAGGLGTSNNDGASGSASLFDALSVSGGLGGKDSTNGRAGGSSVNVSSGISQSIFGSNAGANGTSAGGNGGTGGGSTFGMGGTAGVANTSAGGSASTNGGGGGGGGGASGVGTLYNGGNGGSGFVLVQY